MKQCIAVLGVVPSGGFGLKIQAVYKINNLLHVVTRLFTPSNGSMVVARPQQISDKAIVTIDTDQPLPVLHYLVGSSSDALESVSEINKYMVRNSGTQFMPLACDQFAKLAAKCLYRPRTDGMEALRLERFEEGQAISAFKNPHTTDERWLYSYTQMKAILNIYTVVDDGLIKVVFESITAENKQKCPNIDYLFEYRPFDFDESISLERHLLMSKDDTLHFDAQCAQIKTRFKTSAVEFTLPADELGVLLIFARLVDKVIMAAKKKSPYTTPYEVIQTSSDSVYSCFKELFISTISEYRIENEMPISIEAFLSKPGSLPAPNSVGGYLLEHIISNTHLPKYASLREFLLSIYKPGISPDQIKPEVYLEKHLGVDFNLLYRSQAALADKLEIIGKLEHYLSDEKNLKRLKPLIAEFNAIALLQLIEPLLHKKIAADGGFYQPSHTELAVLLTANFCTLKDGRLSIQMKGNPGYEQHYAPGANNHEICETELTHLAKDLGLHFSLGSNFHGQLIFDHASTLMLKGWGVHINETNLQLQLDQAKNKVNVVPSSIFPPAVAKALAVERQESGYSVGERP